MTTQPSTAAGRALLEWIADGHKPYPEQVAAIEKEAADAALAGLAEKVRRFHDEVCACPADGTDEGCHAPWTFALLESVR